MPCSSRFVRIVSDAEWKLIQANREIVPRPANLAGTESWHHYKRSEAVFVFDDCVPEGTCKPHVGT